MAGPRRIRRPPGREEGATLVESALVLPIVILVTLAIIDGGLWFKDYLSIGRAARDGARAAVAQPADSMADYDVLKAVGRNLAGIEASKIHKVVVYDARYSGSGNGALTATNPLENAPPGNCTDDLFGVAGRCNVYTAADLLISEPAYSLPAFTKKDDWSGADRDVWDDADGTGYVGVFLEVEVPMVTGVLGGTKLVRDFTVMRFEPQGTVPLR